MPLLGSSIVVSLSAGLLLVLFLALGLGVLCWKLVQRTRQLAQSRSYLEFVLDHIKDGILILAPDHKILLRNATAMRLASPTANPDGKYRPVDEQVEVFSMDGVPIPHDQWPSERALSGDFVTDYGILCRHKISGESGARKVSTAPVPGSNGAVIVSYRDDTPRRLLDQARIRLAEIVESSDDAIIANDAEGIVTSWNKGAEKTFGYAATEMIGQPSKCLLPANRHIEDDAILRRILKGELIEHFETTRLHKEGRLIQVSLRISPIFDATGNVIGCSKIARDITETRILERQTRQSQKMEAIGQLTGGIAHDFNNLLGIILGNLELLDHELQAPPTAHEDIAQKITNVTKRNQTAQRAAKRAAELTTRLLAFSATNEQLKPATTNLQHAIRNMLELGSRALGPEITVTTVFDQTLLPVLVDPSGLENALLNLVVNARDAMPNGGVLRITTKEVELEERMATVKSHGLRAGRYACVAVSDNGTGMSRETLDRAFEPFFTTKSRTQGTGLGLAMVYGFLKQSHGAASIYSEPGYGTTVSLYLPYADPRARTTTHTPAEYHSRHNGTVLLVDDEPDLLDIAATYLKRLGYTTYRAKNGPDALRVLSENPDIDIMVTDIIMPGGMNGVELVQRVRDISPSTRCIYTSGFPSDALAHKSLELDDCILMHKPYRLAELGAVIKSSLQEQPNA